MNQNTHLNPERQFLLEHIKYNKHIVRAKGHYFYDRDGIAYLDFLAQYGAVPFGHNPDAIWEALTAVREREEPALMQPFVSHAAESLAQKLSNLSPGGKRYVTFTNSGAESVEAAIKIARSKTRRQIILSATGGFHGKTLGAVSATANDIYRAPFLTDTTAFERVVYNDINALQERLSREDVAAFIVEAVQGEGGMVVPDIGYLTEAAHLCKKTGTLFVLDEVQTGLGRTGRLFASEHDGIDPDILLLSKALGGGLLPLGACLCKERVWDKNFGFYHSSTFANNHLTCTVGLATLGFLCGNDSALMRKVEQKGDYLRLKLDELVIRYPTVYTAVSGKGLMQGIKLAQWQGENSYLMSYVSTSGNAIPLLCGYLLNEHHILTAPSFNSSCVLRIEPALTIEYVEIDRMVAALEQAAVLLLREDYASFLGYVAGCQQGYNIVPTDADFSQPLYPVIKPASKKEICLGSFAFFMHPTEFDDMVNCQPPALQYFNAEQTTKWREWLASWSERRYDPAIIYHMPAIYSKTGGYVKGWLVGSALTPTQMLNLSANDRAKLISDYIDIAADLNVDIVGLGAFTSIITRGGTDLIDCGLNVTTGNSLTAMASAESLKNAVTLNGKNLIDLKTGVIGAAGSVGRLVCKSLVKDCGHFTLFGNPKNTQTTFRLDSLAGELYQDAINQMLKETASGIGLSLLPFIDEIKKMPPDLLVHNDDASLRQLYQFISGVFAKARREAPIEITIDIRDRLRHMNVVVSATSQGNSFIEPEWLAPKAIVCDAARPPDVRASVREKRKDVFVYEGGLIKLPEAIRFGRNNVLNLPTGITLACLSETMVLAMQGTQKRNYSIGNRASLVEAQEIYESALRHGFRLALMDSEVGEITKNDVYAN